MRLLKVLFNWVAAAGAADLARAVYLNRLDNFDRYILAALLIVIGLEFFLKGVLHIYGIGEV